MPAQTSPPTHQGASTTRISKGTLLALLGVGGILGYAAWIGRNLWFFSDDWNIISQYHDGRTFSPFNGHLSAVPIGLYQTLFHTVGLGSYWPYRMLGFCSLILLAVVVYRYTRRLCGDIGGAWCTTLMLWGSAGMSNLLFPFLLNFSLPIACLAGMWMLRERPTRTRQIALAVVAVVAVATSGIGVVVVGAALVEVIWERAPRSAWIPFAPAVLGWSAWYAVAHDPVPTSNGIGSILRFSSQMLFGGFKALGGGSLLAGWVVVALFLFLIANVGVLRVLRDPRTMSAAAAPLAFVAVTSATRVGVFPPIPPDELRYRWTLAAMLILLAARLWSLRTQTKHEALVHRLVPALAVVMLLANVWTLRTEMRGWVQRADATVSGISAALWATQAGTGAPHQIDSHTLPVSYVKVTSGEYRAALGSFSSPIAGKDPGSFYGTSPQHFEADKILFSELGIALTPAASIPNPDACDAAPSDLERGLLPGTTLRLSATASSAVTLGLLSPGIEIGTIPANESLFLSLPSLSLPFGTLRYQVGSMNDISINICS